MDLDKIKSINSLFIHSFIHGPFKTAAFSINNTKNFVSLFQIFAGIIDFCNTEIENALYFP